MEGAREGATASVEVYDPETMSWSEISPLSTARHSHSCSAFNGRLYVVGGVGSDGRCMMSKCGIARFI